MVWRWFYHGDIISGQVDLYMTGPQFALKFIEEFMRALGTTRQLSTVYHSQTDGQMERINQEIEMFLWHYVNYQ